MRRIAGNALIFIVVVWRIFRTAAGLNDLVINLIVWAFNAFGVCFIPKPRIHTRHAKAAFILVESIGTDAGLKCLIIDLDIRARNAYLGAIVKELGRWA
jgi:hypothetical protein